MAHGGTARDCASATVAAPATITMPMPTGFGNDLRRYISSEPQAAHFVRISELNKVSRIFASPKSLLQLEQCNEPGARVFHFTNAPQSGQLD